MKPRILIVALFFAMAFAAWFALRREPPAPSPAPGPAALVQSTASPIPARAYADSPDADAIDAALGFFLRQDAQKRPSWQVYALLDYLQRRFGLDEKYRIENAFPREAWPDYDLEMAALFQRLTDTTVRIDKARILGEPTNLNRFLAGALYCDQHPVDQTFLQEMLEIYQEDVERPAPGYIATHVILACQWLRELGCDKPFPHLETQWSAFPGLLEQIINRENAETDLAFEAMMLLYYIGEGRRVWDAWVDTVRRLQRPSGAWGYAPDKEDHGHPTVLALWVLLENALPRAEKVPWVF